jgi:hypothetical protein
MGFGQLSGSSGRLAPRAEPQQKCLTLLGKEGGRLGGGSLWGSSNSGEGALKGPLASRGTEMRFGSLSSMETKFFLVRLRRADWDTPQPFARSSALKRPAEGEAFPFDQGELGSPLTKGSPGGNEPTGKRAFRSPVLRRSAASRKAATNKA